MKKSIIKRLNSLAKDIRKAHPHVDSGGCCVVASHLAEHLPESLKPKVLVLTSYGTLRDIDEVLEIIKDDGADPIDINSWDNRGINFNHVVVEFRIGRKHYCFDSTNGLLPSKRYFKVEKYSRHEGTLPVDIAIGLAGEAQWNCAFDRAGIPDIKHKIDKSMSKINSLISND